MSSTSPMPLQEFGRMAYRDLARESDRVASEFADTKSVRSAIDVRLSVAVMICTRNRPKMLDALLRSLQQLEIKEDDNYDVLFVVVDNDPNRSSKAVVDEFRNRIGDRQVEYFVEEKTGIPFARNEALQRSSALGADLGAFIDDDELPDPRWLSELVDCYRTRGLDLIGGPVRPQSWETSQSLTQWERLVLNGVKYRYKLKEQRSAWMEDTNKDGKITIITSNWMINFSWWNKDRLLFDEDLRYSGGSDALFYSQAKALNANTGWRSTAVVYESSPPERLTLSYQFDRAQAQSASGFFRKNKSINLSVTCSTLFSIVVKTLGSSLVLILAPFRPGVALVQSARSLGWAAGRLRALFGKQSNFYLTTDGE